jgi:hypothetical protein
MAMIAYDGTTVPPESGGFAPAPLPFTGAGGQLDLLATTTGAAATCGNCGQPITEVATLTATVWTHADGDWRCARGGLATPRGWSE